jgi:hypothetical protein
MSSPGSRPLPQPKIVEITVAKGKCDPDRAEAYNIDSIKWTGDVTELEFPQENPFETGQGKKFKPNKVYKVQKLKGTFSYNVTTSTGTYDPDVVIEPPPQ